MRNDKLTDQYCPQCGTKLKKSDKFCSGCGTKINEEKIVTTNKIQKNGNISNKKDNLNIRNRITKKHLIIGLVAIIGIILIISLYGILNSPSITNVTVEKEGKLYQINYSYSCSREGIDDDVHIAVYKNGKCIGSGEGTNYTSEGNTFYIKINEDTDIDEIRFSVMDNSNNRKCIYMKVVDNFNILKAKNLKDPFNDIDGYTLDETDKKELLEWEITESHRDLYDFDGDGFLDDYEFQKFCEGEGQEELLDYNK